MNGRILHAINAVLLFAMIAASILAWPGLPAEIPIHFGPTGQADRWADTTMLSWFGLPVLAVLLTVGFYLLAAVVPIRPGWLNLREKKRFLALPESARAPVYERAQVLTYMSVTFVLVILDLVQLAVYQEAHLVSAQPLVRSVLIVAGAGSVVISTYAIVGMQRAIDESLRLARQS